MQPVAFERLRHVLVVEPFADLAALLTELLGRVGLAAVTVASGEAALAEAARTPFDLLVTELRLGGTMDGAELLDRWRALGSHAPVIFVADRVELVPREKLALDDCCASIMKKPMNFDAFLRALQAADARVHHADCVHRRRSPIAP